MDVGQPCPKGDHNISGYSLKNDRDQYEVFVTVNSVQFHFHVSFVNLTPQPDLKPYHTFALSSIRPPPLSTDQSVQFIAAWLLILAGFAMLSWFSVLQVGHILDLVVELDERSGIFLGI